MEEQGRLSLDEPLDPSSQGHRSAPGGLRFTPDFLASSEEAALLGAIDEAPWMTDLSRRVQHYGWRYDYKARRIGPESYLGPLPPFLQSLRDRVRSAAGFAADQAIVNEYVPGQGIAPHVDCEPCFGPVVAMVGLASDTQMDFVRKADGTSWSMRFTHGGLLVLAGDARYQWTHGIAKRRADAQFDVRRARRVSVTFRLVRSSGKT